LATGIAEFNLHIPVSTSVYLTAGASTRLLYDFDLAEAVQRGEANDFISGINLGVAIDLGRTAKDGEIIISERRLDLMQSDLETAKKDMEKQKMESDSELRDRDMQIAMLRRERDSLRAEASKRVLPADDDKEVVASGTVPSSDRADYQEQWRVVIGSFATQDKAQRFIDRTQLDRSGMEVLYVEELETYRLIYKSFDTMGAALKARDEVRGSISDAWVIKF
jgi:hypothetical protein